MAETTRPHYDQAQGKGKISKSQIPDAEMSSVDPMAAKLTQCEKEYFLLISAANHSEWLRDPLDEGGDATGPLTGGVAA
jgi:hypothetical protein